MAQEIRISFVGPDRTGLIAHITNYLFDKGVNIGDITLSVLGDHAELTLIHALPNGVTKEEIEKDLKAMSELDRLNRTPGSASNAMVLFLAGMLGIYVEVNNPGLLIPGIAGALCLVLAAIAFQILPFSWVGLVLIVALAIVGHAYSSARNPTAD